MIINFFYLRRSRQIRAGKVFFFLLLWGHISFLLKYSFLGWKKSKLFPRKGCVKSKTLLKKKKVWLVKKWNTLLVKIDAADQ